MHFQVSNGSYNMDRIWLLQTRVLSFAPSDDWLKNWPGATVAEGLRLGKMRLASTAGRRLIEAGRPVVVANIVLSYGNFQGSIKQVSNRWGKI